MHTGMHFTVPARTRGIPTLFPHLHTLYLRLQRTRARNVPWASN